MERILHNTNSLRSEADICKLWEVFEAIDPEYDMKVPVCYARPRDGRTQQDPTGIPEAFHDADIFSFKFDVYQDRIKAENLHDLAFSFFEKYEQWEKCGKWLYLWSYAMGSGKSFLSCCLANSIRIKYNLRCRFVSAVDYLAAVGDGYDRKGEPDPSAKYRECDLLILDDLGAHKSGEWQVQEIFRLIDERMKASLAAIITANMPLDGQKIGERTVNRIYSKCVSFHLPEESIRAKIAQAENEKFLAEVLGKK